MPMLKAKGNLTGECPSCHEDATFEEIPNNETEVICMSCGATVEKEDIED